MWKWKALVILYRRDDSATIMLKSIGINIIICIFVWYDMMIWRVKIKEKGEEEEKGRKGYWHNIMLYYERERERE